MAVTLLPFSGGDRASLEDAVEIYSQDSRVLAPEEVLRPAKRLVQLRLDGDTSRHDIGVDVTGVYALFAEHCLSDFGGQLRRGLEVISPVLTHDYQRDVGGREK